MGHFVNPGFRKKPQGKQNFRLLPERTLVPGGWITGMSE